MTLNFELASVYCYSVIHFHLVFLTQHISKQMIIMLGVLQLSVKPLEVDVPCVATKTCAKRWLNMT